MSIEESINFVQSYMKSLPNILWSRAKYSPILTFECTTHSLTLIRGVYWQYKDFLSRILMVHFLDPENEIQAIPYNE